MCHMRLLHNVGHNENKKIKEAPITLKIKIKNKMFNRMNKTNGYGLI